MLLKYKGGMIKEPLRSCDYHVICSWQNDVTVISIPNKSFVLHHSALLKRNRSQDVFYMGLVHWSFRLSR